MADYTPPKDAAIAVTRTVMAGPGELHSDTRSIAALRAAHEAAPWVHVESIERRCAVADALEDWLREHEGSAEHQEGLVAQFLERLNATFLPTREEAA